MKSIFTVNKIILICFFLAVVGCGISDTENSEPLNDTLESSDNILVLPEQQRQHHYTLSELIPGYGGFYLINEDRTLVAGVTRPDEVDQGKASEDIRNFFSIEAPSIGKEVEIIFRPSKYTYTQLIDWYDSIIAKAWNTAEVKGASIGVPENKLFFIITSNEDLDKVKAVLAENDVPEDAVGFSYSRNELTEPNPVYWK
ncbi:MAG: hypothetical protein WD037_02215 [Balneolales bacterium]